MSSCCGWPRANVVDFLEQPIADRLGGELGVRLQRSAVIRVSPKQSPSLSIASLMPSVKKKNRSPVPAESRSPRGTARTARRRRGSAPAPCRPARESRRGFRRHAPPESGQTGNGRRARMSMFLARRSTSAYVIVMKLAAVEMARDDPVRLDRAAPAARYAIRLSDNISPFSSAM